MRSHQIYIILLFILCARAQADGVSVTTHDGTGGRVVVQSLGNRTYLCTAEPAIGYEFRGWTDGVMDISRTYSHPNIEEYVRLEAIFGKSAYVSQQDGRVNIQVEDATLPSFRLDAVPNSEATFDKWNDGRTNSQIPYVEADGNIFPVFNYLNPQFRVVTRDGAGGACQLERTGNRTYCFTARANSGYTFWGWSDGIDAATNPRCYTFPEDQEDYATFYAVFTKNDDINQPNGTTLVSIDDPTTPSFNLSAQPNTDAEFFSWNNGVSVSSIQYRESDGSRIPLYGLPNNHLRVTVINRNGGQLTLDPITGRKYSILASPNDGYSFWGWTDGIGSLAREYEHPVSAAQDKVLHAVFTKNGDVKQPGGKINVSVQTPDMPNFYLSAQADLECGTSFSIWNNGENTQTIDYEENDGTRIPYFTHGDNAVGYTLINAHGGRIDVSKDSCGFSLNPIPNEGYLFLNWEDNTTEYPRYVDYVAATYQAMFSMANFKVENEYFVTLDEAIQYAGDNKIIELIHNLDSLVVSENIHLDGRSFTISHLEISNGACVTLAGELIADSLFLFTTSGQSSQLKGENMLSCQQAYVDIVLDPLHPQAVAELWYAIAVPFPVDVQSGIYRQAGDPSHVLGRDYMVYEYDGDLRASTGSGWKLMTHGLLIPGKFYMIAVADNQNIWRMQKDTAVSWMNVNPLPLYQYFTTSCKHRGWNAVANPLSYYVDAMVESGIQIAQVYVNGADPARYDVKNLNESSFVMASPFFIQTADNDNLLFTSASHNTLYAPGRQSPTTNCVRVCLCGDDGAEKDVVYITPSNNAQNYYELGKDVLKLGNNANYPRLSANAYGYNLCAQYVPVLDNEAVVNLQTFIPQNGSYSFDLNRSQLDNQTAVYLLENGRRIWNLSESPYTLNIKSGLHQEYSLQILYDNVITTHIEDKSIEHQKLKYVQNGVLYMQVNGTTYDAFGMKY